MGQYFKYGLANGKEGVSPTWLGMTGHSFIANDAVSLLYYQLLSGDYAHHLNLHEGKMLGRWKKKPVVHCGDYSEVEVNGIKLYDALRNSCEKHMHKLQLDIFGSIVSEDNRFDGDVDLFEDSLNRLFNGIPLYIVNHSCKQYLDVRAQIFMHRVLESEKPGELYGMVDPLSLLLVETDGGGGGDYHGEYEELVGAWSQDQIENHYALPCSVQDKAYRNITLELYFSEDGDFSENGSVSLSKRKWAYAEYINNFSRINGRAGNKTVSRVGRLEADNYQDMKDNFDSAIKQALKDIGKHFQSVCDVLEVEIVGIASGLMKVATVDENLNYCVLGQLPLVDSRALKIGDVVKVKNGNGLVLI